MNKYTHTYVSIYFKPQMLTQDADEIMHEAYFLNFPLFSETIFEGQINYVWFFNSTQNVERFWD